MGYASLSLALLIGVSFMFHMYSETLIDNNKQNAAPYDAILTNLPGNISSGSFSVMNYIQQNLKDAFLGTTTGIAIGVLSGFASIYLIPAMAIGALAGLFLTPWSSIMVVTMNSGMPTEIALLFVLIEVGLLISFIIEFIRGSA